MSARWGSTVGVLGEHTYLERQANISKHVEEEAHCYVVQCRRIVCGQYIADYSTTECRTFRPEGLRQLRTKLRMYSVRLVYIAMGNCV